MSKEELMSMFEKEVYPNSDYIQHYRVEEFEVIIDKIIIKHKLELSELEAKVYTYEKIIANSNFAPILKENKKSKKESKGDKDE